MQSNNNSEIFFLRYKSEAVTNKDSIRSFCFRNKVPYNLFEKWLRCFHRRWVEIRTFKEAEHQLCLSHVRANMLKRMIKEVKREPWSLRTVWISSLERNVIITKRILFLKKESDDHLLCNVTVCYTLVVTKVQKWQLHIMV